MKQITLVRTVMACLIKHMRIICLYLSLSIGLTSIAKSADLYESVDDTEGFTRLFPDDYGDIWLALPSGTSPVTLVGSNNGDICVTTQIKITTSNDETHDRFLSAITTALMAGNTVSIDLHNATCQSTPTRLEATRVVIKFN